MGGFLKKCGGSPQFSTCKSCGALRRDTEVCIPWGARRKAFHWMQCTVQGLCLPCGSWWVPQDRLICYARNGKKWASLRPHAPNISKYLHIVSWEGVIIAIPNHTIEDNFERPQIPWHCHNNKKTNLLLLWWQGSFYVSFDGIFGSWSAAHWCHYYFFLYLIFKLFYILVLARTNCEK